MIPSFTAEAALDAGGVYRSVRQPATAGGPAVVPAELPFGRATTHRGFSHGGQCVSFCDAFGCIWCCGGVCDPEYH